MSDEDFYGVLTAAAIVLVALVVLGVLYWDCLPWSYDSRLDRRSKRTSREDALTGEVKRLCAEYDLPWVDTQPTVNPPEIKPQPLSALPGRVVTPDERSWLSKDVVWAVQEIQEREFLCSECVRVTLLSSLTPPRVLLCRDCRTSKIEKGCVCFYGNCSIHP